MSERPRLNALVVQGLVREALAEDVGSGDVTTHSIVPEQLRISANIVAREAGRLAGMPVAEAVFHDLDSRASLEVQVEEGAPFEAGTLLATVKGSARAILTGERTALNFLQRMSGIATLTADYVAALGADSRTRLLDTRKTTPCLRKLEKYAVLCGGGSNHRMGLYDRIMIKDNHRMLAGLAGPGGIPRAVRACRKNFPFLQIEVEADTLDDVKAALDLKVDFVLLDNMSNEEITEAISLRDEVSASTLLEVSGGVTLQRIPSLAALGVDFISAGALTHSARAIDIGLDLRDDPVYPG